MIRSSTIVGNRAPAPTGGGLGAASTATTFRIANTILDSRDGGNRSDTTALTSEGFNLVSDSTCPLVFSGPAPDNIEAQIRLSPLGLHGGQTRNYLPVPDSDALDVAPAPARAAAPRRPTSGVCRARGTAGPPERARAATSARADWPECDADAPVRLLASGQRPDLHGPGRRARRRRYGGPVRRRRHDPGRKHSEAGPTTGPAPQQLPDDDDTPERPRKEAEEERHQRERGNAAGQDEYRTEGNVVEVHLDEKPPYIIIGTRDGPVTLRVRGDAARLVVKIGDYVTAEGEKVHEQLYEVDSLKVE